MDTYGRCDVMMVWIGPGSFPPGVSLVVGATGVRGAQTRTREVCLVDGGNLCSELEHSTDMSGERREPVGDLLPTNCINHVQKHF
jgi:hypothetical protein